MVRGHDGKLSSQPCARVMGSDTSYKRKAFLAASPGSIYTCNRADLTYGIGAAHKGYA